MAGVHRVHALLANEAPVRGATEAEMVAQSAEAIRADGLLANALTFAARARLLAGKSSRALALSTRALEIRDRLSGIEEDEAEVFRTHADALAACGRAKEARATLERGKARLLEIARGITDPDWRARFLRDVPAHRAMLAGEVGLS
jgi:hypothetical protein